MNEYEKALNETEEKEKEFISTQEEIAIGIYAGIKSINGVFIDLASVGNKLSVVEANKFNRLSQYVNDVYTELDKLKINIPEFDNYLREVADINFERTTEALSDLLDGNSLDLTVNEYDDLVNTIFKNNSINNNIARAKIKFSQEVRQSIASNKGIRDLNSRTKKIVEEVTNNNSTIVRTQTTKTMNNTRELTFKKANEISEKEIGKVWISRRDEKVRASHKSLDNGIAIKLNKAFDNGLMYPGDPSGSVSEVANCRCELEHKVIES